jgi:hypothetical protein
MTVVSDNFNRANESPIAGNWVNLRTNGPLYLQSNVVVPNNVTADGKAVWKVAVNPIGADQFSEAVCNETFNTTSSGVGPGVCLRADEAAGDTNGTMYRIVINDSASGNIEIGRFNAGTFSGTLAFLTAAFTSGDTMRAYIVGYVITVKINGVTVGTPYDDSASGSKIATGQPGIAYSSAGNTPSIDTWRGGDGDGSAVTNILLPGTKTWAFPNAPIGGARF